MIYIIGGGFPAPDYESTWTNINNASFHTFPHFLGSDNILIQAWQANAANWNNALCLTTFWGLAPVLRCYIERISNNGLKIYNGDTIAHYYKLRIWKF